MDLKRNLLYNDFFNPNTANNTCLSNPFVQRN